MSNQVLAAIGTLTSVVTQLLNETPISPPIKADLTTQLNSVFDVVKADVATGVQSIVTEVANGETAAVPDTIAQTVGQVAGVAVADVADAVPIVGPAIAPEAEALVSHAVASAVSHFESIFVSHNKALLDAIAGLIVPAHPLAESAPTTAAAQDAINNA